MTLKPCGQCGEDFEAKSINHCYCSRPCQVDHLRLVKPEMSLRRKQTGYAWEPVKAAPKKKTEKRKGFGVFSVAAGWKTAVVFPDQQFGYRRYLDTGELDPFHDPRAIEIAESIVEAEKPDVSVLLGDLNDNASFGRFRQEPEFVAGVQPGIDRASVHVSTVASHSKKTRILKGNHDIRIENQSLDNLSAAAGLRRAKRRPGEYPLLTMEFLLGLDEMPDTKMIGGYPSGAYYINDNLACIHGRVTGSDLANKVINAERVSIIMGHIHRFFDGMMTFNNNGWPSFVRAYSSGCLCRVDGAVPSTKSGRDPFGRPMRSWENWQQGLTIVRYLPDNGKFTFEDVRIFEGFAMHRGQTFESNKSTNDPEYDLIPESGVWSE